MADSHATICSLLPHDLHERKPGLTPTEFVIPGKKDKEFSLTVIDDRTFYMVNPDVLSDAKEVPHIKVPVPAYQIAESIINDYINGLLGVEPPDAVPGLFYVGGTFHEHKEFKSKFSEHIKVYSLAQNTWFQRLIDIADDTWSKTRSPVGISDIQRNAVRALGYQRDWLNPLPSEQIAKCMICATPVNQGALKCHVCGFIFNKAEYDRVLALAAK